MKENKETRPQPGDRPKERKHVPGKVLPFLVRELLHEIKGGALTIWIVMFLHSNREGYCFLANKTLSRESGIGLKALQRQKKKLKKAGWITNCGQRSGWQSNTYKVSIPIPKTVASVIDSIELKILAEDWYEDVRFDEHDYAEDHLDWLVAWRVMVILKKNGWKGGAGKISAETRRLSEFEAMSIIRLAARGLIPGSLNDPGPGLWWLWGDGFDAAVDELKRRTPVSKRPRGVGRSDSGG